MTRLEQTYLHEFGSVIEKNTGLCALCIVHISGQGFLRISLLSYFPSRLSFDRDGHWCHYRIWMVVRSRAIETICMTRFDLVDNRIFSSWKILRISRTRLFLGMLYGVVLKDGAWHGYGARKQNKRRLLTASCMSFLTCLFLPPVSRLFQVSTTN